MSYNFLTDGETDDYMDRQRDVHTSMHAMTIHATEDSRTPVQCRGFAGQPLQVLLPCRQLQSFHISPVRRANDVKQGLQLRLCCAVAWACLCTEHLAAFRQARTNTAKQLTALGNQRGPTPSNAWQ